MSNCHCTTDITSDGSSQLGRYLKALDPSYAPVDERSLNDLLVFAKRYAAQIRFYDIPESKIDDGVKPEKLSWREFFRRDMAVIAASIGVLNTTAIKENYDAIRVSLEDQPTAEKLAGLFQISIGIATRIDRWYTVAIPENPLHDYLVLGINSTLKTQMKRIMAYEEGFKFVDVKNPLQLDYSGIENDAVWGLKGAVEQDASIYQGTTSEDKIRYAALYADELFQDFFSFLNNLVQASDGFMQFAIESYPGHQPHMALFIAFLQLFRLAQEQMNGLTEKMLNFYYRDVLQFTAKKSIPDKAHIVFELAKDVVEYDIANNTLLKAGKDASGKEQLYKTTTNLVVNQAKVKELKTIFIEKLPATAAQQNETIHSVYAMPVANSADGYGLPFTEANPKWPTFGKGKTVSKEPKNICDAIDATKELLNAADAVQTGFAIASPQLVLQGGKRLITVFVQNLKQLFPDAAAMMQNGKPLFDCWFTAEKEWLKVGKMMADAEWALLNKYFDLGIDVFNFEENTIETSYYVDIENDAINIYLPVAEKPVIAFDAKLHTGYDYQTNYPVVQLMLNPEINVAENIYKSLRLTNLIVDIRVGSINPSAEKRKDLQGQNIQLPDYHFDGLKTFVLQNDDGLITPGKPFNPFTQYPFKGKSLYIGSEEIFNKPLGELAVNILKTITANDRDIVFAASVLYNRSWDKLSALSGGDFSQMSFTENILNKQTGNVNTGSVSSYLLSLSRKPIAPVTEWKQQTEKGFIQIDNLKQVDPTGNMSFLQASQDMAPELEIKEISLSYHSTLGRLENGIDQFFHVYPFGVVETYLGTKGDNGIERKAGLLSGRKSNFSLLDQQKNYLLVNANNILLPQYTFESVYTKYATSQSSSDTNTTFQQSDILIDLMINASGIKERAGGSNNQYSALIQEEGMLFIGLEKAKPLQSLSLLFEFAEGSAEDEDNDPPPIHWSYLTNNEWRPMHGEDVVTDGTYGFQTTGIVKLNIPADATNNNTIITTGLYWLCASVTENANRIPQLVDVVTQVVEAIFIDNDNDQTHFDTSLPKGSINKLSVAVAEVSKVMQPFASFDGKHKEAGKEFYTRVSERLRHKGRAINSWDYEHLVLDRFPVIYKVKCITHTDPNCLCRTGTHKNASTKSYQVVYNADLNFDDTSRVNIELAAKELIANTNLLVTLTAYGNTPEDIKLAANMNEAIKKQFLSEGIGATRITTNTASNATVRTIDITISGYTVSADTISCCGPQIVPGHVLLVPIANLKNRNSINLLQPKTSRRVLLEIEAYLKNLTSPFVKVHAKNPVYEQVIVAFKVKFYTGTDKGFYLKKLNEEIVAYLTPWAFDDNAEVKFGQKIYASSIINFIEERVYVDFITEFIMGVCKDECCPADITTGGNDGEDKTVAEVLANVCGCNEIEELLSNLRDKAGEIVAKPSTQRSILVSVPQHIIIPYEEPQKISPCEQRKMAGNVVTKSPSQISNAGLDTVVINEEKVTGSVKKDTSKNIRTVKDVTKKQGDHLAASPAENKIVKSAVVKKVIKTVVKKSGKKEK